MCGALAGALGGLGCTRYLQMEQVEASMRTGILEQLGLEVVALDCPESRELRVEDSFDCSARTEGGAVIRVVVTQIDDAGQVEWETAESDGILNLEGLAEQIRVGLQKETGDEALVDCGAAFGDTPPGQTFECVATDGEGNAAIVTVAVKDREGNVDWSIAEEAAQPIR